MDPGVTASCTARRGRRRKLRLSYDGLDAVRGIDLRVSRGEIFALLGPNGVGRPTTVEILEGHLKRTAGDVRVLGADPERADRWWRSRLAWWSKARESSRSSPCESASARRRVLPGAAVGTGGDRARRPEAALGGSLWAVVRWRAAAADVALALIGDPDLVFLDEPTAGFDPSARRSAWEMIDGLRRLGKTIFLELTEPPR
jgi:ABC-2 type transport system ATP-binding protein